MSEWKEYTLKDVIEKFIDYRGKTPNKVSKGIPLITAKVVKDGSILTPNEFIEESEYLSWMTRGFPKKNDVLLTTEAPLGEVAMITNENIALAQRIILLRGKPSLLDNHFLFYSLRTRLMQHRLEARASGSTVKGIKSSELREIMIPLTSVPEQKRIADVLSCLDAKIENLRKQNNTLEQIAQTLFKHWFIDFEFPNTDGKPYKSSGGEMQSSVLGDIPKGWHILTLKQICQTIYRYPQFYGMEKVESGIPVIRSEHLLKTGRISFDFSDYWFVKDDYSAKFPKTILEEFDVVLSVRGSIGNFSVVGKKHINSQISPNTIRLSANSNILKKFLLHPCLKVNLFKQKLLSIVSSSAVPAINAFEFKTFEFVIPEMSVQDRLSNVFKDLYKKVDINEHQIETLIKTRDALLPKLMSGQIRIEE